ncbi:hypothetical protein [Streptomyces sp. NPDC002205]
MTTGVHDHGEGPIWWHPFFITSGGRAPTARVELRRLARERGQRTARAS